VRRWGDDRNLKQNETGRGGYKTVETLLKQKPTKTSRNTSKDEEVKAVMEKEIIAENDSKYVSFLQNTD